METERGGWMGHTTDGVCSNATGGRGTAASARTPREDDACIEVDLEGEGDLLAEMGAPIVVTGAALDVAEVPLTGTATRDGVAGAVATE